MNAVVVSPSPSVGDGLTFIEQLHALSVQLCEHQKVPYLTAIRNNRAYLLRGTCKMWSCNTCGARNARQWQARILNHINSENGKKKRWYFLTITAHEKWRGKNSSIKNIRQGWKKLYNRMRRAYGVSEYVKVWEYHKDGSFHLHLLIGRKIGKSWLKKNSRECGMGYQCDSSASKNGGQVAGYISKYLLKSFENKDMYTKGIRRIEASRDWTPLPELNKSNDHLWIVCQNRTFQDKHAEFLKRQGIVITDMRPHQEATNNTYVKIGETLS